MPGRLPAVTALACCLVAWVGDSVAWALDGGSAAAVVTGDVITSPVAAGVAVPAVPAMGAPSVFRLVPASGFRPVPGFGFDPVAGAGTAPTLAPALAPEPGDDPTTPARPFPVPGLTAGGGPAASGRTFASLLDLAGYRVGAVVEGLLPVPRFCVTLDRIGRRTPQERAAAEREIARHFAGSDLSWYDVWTHAQKLILDTLIAAERRPSRYAEAFGTRLIRIDVGVLPVPWARQILLPVTTASSGSAVAGRSDQADLVADLGYDVVRIEEGWTVVGGSTTIVLRRNHPPTAMRRQDVLARISAWVADRQAMSMVDAYWDTVFFTLLRWIETGSLGFGWLRDTVVDDLAITLAVIPGASLRRRPSGAAPLSDMVVPCS